MRDIPNLHVLCGVGAINRLSFITRLADFIKKVIAQHETLHYSFND